MTKKMARTRPTITWPQAHKYPSTRPLRMEAGRHAAREAAPPGKPGSTRAGGWQRQLPTTPRNAMRARPSRAGQWGRWRPSKEDAQRFLSLRVGIGRRCTCANDWSCRIRPFPARWPATVRFGRHTPASRHGYVGLLLMQSSAGQIRRSWPGKELGRDDAALARLGAGPNGR